MTGEAHGDGGRPAVLDARQKQLVAANLGLVGVHLKRHVGAIPRPRWDREREDLFQEGCLGLIRAVRAYDPASGIPFAAFALLRIRNAVSTALQRRFRTVPLPPRGCGDKPAKRGDETGGTVSIEPRVRNLSAREARCLAARPALHSSDTRGETVGDRLRRKYRRAVGAATAAMLRRPSRRGDRRRLLHILIKERFLIPPEHGRRALRQIARDTHSSYARVAECEQNLAAFIRRWLAADPEFGALREAARRSSAGTAKLIDAPLERTLAANSSNAFIARLRLADRENRTRLLSKLLALPGAPPPNEFIRRHVAALPHTARQRLWALEETASVRPAPRRRSA